MHATAPRAAPRPAAPLLLLLLLVFLARPSAPFQRVGAPGARPGRQCDGESRGEGGLSRPPPDERGKGEAIEGGGGMSRPAFLRRSFTGPASAAMATVLAEASPPLAPLATARGLVVFPCKNGLQCTYHLMRAGESLMEEDGVLMTNPLFLTNRENALSSKGTAQVERSASILSALPADMAVSQVRYSLAANSLDTANLLGRELCIGRDRLVPEFNFMDPRAIGKYDALPLGTAGPAILALDADEAGPNGMGGRPPPNDDGTPAEILSDQVVRVRQLLSVTETLAAGDVVVLVFPDGTGPALLSCLIGGIPLSRAHELDFAPGEVRLDVNYRTVREGMPEVPSEEYRDALEAGRGKLEELRRQEREGGGIRSVKEQSEEREVQEEKERVAVSALDRKRQEEEARLRREEMKRRVDEERKRRADTLAEEKGRAEAERERARKERDRARAEKERARVATIKQDRDERERIQVEASKAKQEKRGGVEAQGDASEKVSDLVMASLEAVGVLGVGALAYFASESEDNDSPAPPATVTVPIIVEKGVSFKEKEVRAMEERKAAKKGRAGEERLAAGKVRAEEERKAAEKALTRSEHLSEERWKREETKARLEEKEERTKMGNEGEEQAKRTVSEAPVVRSVNGKLILTDDPILVDPKGEHTVNKSMPTNMNKKLEIDKSDVRERASVNDGGDDGGVAWLTMLSEIITEEDSQPETDNQ